MKLTRIGKPLLSLLLAALLVISLPASLSALELSTGKIYVNDELFDGTLIEAIEAGYGGKVTVSGKVYTTPIGGPGREPIVDEVIIEGTNNAEIVLQPFYFDDYYTNMDVITIRGKNVTLRNVTVDACFLLDYPVRIFPGSKNVLVENVTAKHGMRGAVDVLCADNITLRNVSAQSSRQAGYVVQATYNSVGITFENCESRGNWRAGVMVRNGYAGVTNVDLSGITCHEGTFSVEDRMTGTIDGGPRQEIIITAPPKNADGTPISYERGILYPLEAAYQHIRFGIADHEVGAASASILTNRYGFESTVYYLTAAAAENDLREGETINPLPATGSIFGKLLFGILFLPRLVAKVYRVINP